MKSPTKGKNLVYAMASEARQSGPMSLRAQRGNLGLCHCERSAAIWAYVIASAARQSGPMSLRAKRGNLGLCHCERSAEIWTYVIASAARQSGPMSLRAQRGNLVISTAFITALLATKKGA